MKRTSKVRSSLKNIKRLIPSTKYIDDDDSIHYENTI